MAKGLRASNKKLNKTRLRASVFESVEKARNDRLSAKLLALAAEPKPSRDKDVEMESTDADLKEADKNLALEQEAMAVDKPNEPVQISPKRPNKLSRIQKKRKTKSIVFPVGRKDSKPQPKPRKK